MSQPTLAEFRARCRSWLEQNAERRAADRQEFVWGEGSDSVALFNNISLEEEAAVVEGSPLAASTDALGCLLQATRASPTTALHMV